MIQLIILKKNYKLKCTFTQLLYECTTQLIRLCQSFQMESKTNESRIISAIEIYINMSDEMIHNPHVTALHKRFAHYYDFSSTGDCTRVNVCDGPCTSQTPLLNTSCATYSCEGQCTTQAVHNPPSAFNRHATAAHVPKGCTLRKHSSYSPKARRDAASEKLLFDGTRQYQGKHSSCTSRAAISESM